eukprot:TRINITY_DN8913_c0_g1_i1.p1 TRINITY_DN8913_c0_g1~~TRINITY_DN8913_c0_g1_i1.p1  ORF type:complete len:345 (+),score=52.53 TRINITY_DN8913_c0_g1_i1:54-1088(+)
MQLPIRSLLQYLCLARFIAECYAETLLEALTKKAVPIAELQKAPTWDEFYKNHVRANRPLVIRGIAKDQPAYKLWTDTYLRDNFGKRRVVPGCCGLNDMTDRPPESFQQYLDDEHKPENKDVLYMLTRFGRKKKAREDLNLFAPINCKEFHIHNLDLLLSNGRANVALHSDETDTFVMSLDGQRSFLLLHQDDAHKIDGDKERPDPLGKIQVDDKLHQIEKVNDVIKGELAPGDVLYIPAFYWHEINMSGRGRAISLRFSHTDDWEWDPATTEDFTYNRWGKEGFWNFNDKRLTSPPELKCTPQPAGTTFAQVELIFEKGHGHKHHNDYLRKKKAEAKQKASEL